MLLSIVSSAAFAQERNAAVIRAEGESESAKLISEATKTYGAGMLELRRIEVRLHASGRVGLAATILKCTLVSCSLHAAVCTVASAPWQVRSGAAGAKHVNVPGCC